MTPGKLIPIHLPDYYLGIQTSWELDVWGKLRNKKKAALARYLGTIEAKNLVVTSLVAEVATSYYQLLSLDNQLEIIRENIKLQQDALEMVKIQKLAGDANELAVQQFEIQVLNSQAMELEIIQQIVVAENRINFLLGRYPQPIIRDKQSLLNPVTNTLQTGLPSDMLQNRPDIRQAEFEVMACKADVKSAKAAFYPSFTINGAVGFQAFNPSFLFTSPESIAYGLIGGLTTPLINRNAIKAEFTYANAAQLEALYNYQKSILNGYVEVSNEIASMRSLEKIHELKTAEVDLSTKSIETSNELFKTGRANYIEVLYAQQNTLEARLDLMEIKTRQLFAMINLYKALGGGWQ
jgi:NodT family efflux transporter outer membrane factor (OMF) lipoprotein